MTSGNELVDEIKKLNNNIKILQATMEKIEANTKLTAEI
jgi:hypothetical protein